MKKQNDGSIVLVLPWPPSSNNLYATVRGRRVLSRVGRNYQTDVGLAVYQAGSPRAPEGRLSVQLDFYPPDRRRRDIANCEKILTDSLVRAGVLVDDSLIDRWVMQRREVCEGGRVEVSIKRRERNES